MGRKKSATARTVAGRRVGQGVFANLAEQIATCIQQNVGKYFQQSLGDALVWLAVRFGGGYQGKGPLALVGCVETAIKFIVKIIPLAQKNQAHPAG